MSLPSRRRRWSADRLLTGLFLLGLMAFSIYLGWNALARQPATYALTITGGSDPGTKSLLAKALSKDSARFGLDLTYRECPGSIESLDLVNSGEVDVALVQGGLISTRWRNVMQVLPLHIEPLHLVVKPDLAEAATKSLLALRGKTIKLGERNSGTEALALGVLDFVGLGEPGDYRTTPESHKDLMKITELDLMPDAVFTVESVPSPRIKQLVDKFHYRLVPLPFVKAFARQGMFRDNTLGNELVNRVHLHPIEIPSRSYRYDPAEPSEDLPTIGARVLVVANKDVDPSAIQRLLDAIFQSHFSEVAIPPLDPSLLDLPAEFPLHTGSEKFKKRNNPLIGGEDIDLVDKTRNLAVAFIGGTFVVWQWVRRRLRRRQELGFESYLLKVSAIEREALRLELASTLELAALIDLQADLGRLKNEALERFTDGELEGEALMSGFLTHANDARDYLARLILHARSAVEKQARRQGLAADAAWDLAIGGHDHPEVQEAPGS